MRIIKGKMLADYCRLGRYKLKIVFIVWFGTHTEYDKIDAKTVSYEN